MKCFSGRDNEQYDPNRMDENRSTFRESFPVQGFGWQAGIAHFSGTRNLPTKSLDWGDNDVSQDFFI